MDLSIVLPTYNERENIQRLIPKLEKIIARERWNAEVIVVDDTSPDKTYVIARALAKQYRNIRTIVRPKKQGMGAALRQGYDTARGEIIASIDVDSLDPEDIVRMVRKLGEGYDLVVGSRRAAGGKYEQRYIKTIIKHMLSNMANALIRVLFGTTLNDYSLNCRAMRRKAWNAIRTTENGNAFLIEMIIKMHFAGFKITQIPVVFHDRVYGQSKIRFLREGIRFLSKTFALAKEYGRFRR